MVIAAMKLKDAYSWKKVMTNLVQFSPVTQSCPAFWEICMQVRKQQLELDMEQ